MLKIPSVFAGGALYQQNAWLTIHGQTDAGTAVDAALTGSAPHPFSAARVTADETGAFSLSLLCPPASMESWKITVSAGEDVHVMDDILFGDLWLASGQSNMELSNHFQPDMDAFLASLAGRKIRVYHVDNIEGGGAGQFPYDPSDAAPGRWRDITDKAFLEWMSAAGTAFVKEVYDYLKSTGREMPIGFVNSSWGGTGIPAWIPRDAMDKAGPLLERMRKIGAYPDRDKWNTRGDTNFQQPTCQYNLKIHPLVGIKFRGILWYQGENECGGEPHWRIYKDYLNLYHSTYKELFAAADDFPMLSVLIYPWAYSKGDCWLGYLNQAFIDAAREKPDTFYCTPISDLPPIWGFVGNHPIHPAHKYEVGRRLGLLAESAVYGRAAQKHPAMMDGYTIDGSRILVHFSIPGQEEPMDETTAIRIGEEIIVGAKKQKRPIGLYICGESGTYVPADCEIIAPDTIALSHPGIASPVHAAYGYNSMEEGCNLWAGLYPLAYFRTDDRQWNAENADGIIQIQCKPWCDPTRTSVWAAHLRPDCGELLDVFYHPIWKSTCGCEVAHDRAFTLEDGSIRIALSESEYSPAVRSSVIGAYVESHPYN
ncbi:MAG: hypothetical protein IJX14_11350, partial [Clostridia bacterium]|nr:hypothetical protein [Clostridia bacterium]